MFGLIPFGYVVFSKTIISYANVITFMLESVESQHGMNWTGFDKMDDFGMR